MVLIESYVIKFQYLGLIEVLNIRKRERDGESGKRCYELKLQHLWKYPQDHSPSWIIAIILMALIMRITMITIHLILIDMVD